MIILMSLTIAKGNKKKIGFKNLQKETTVLTLPTVYNATIQ